jgi:hypothetical protein
MPIYTVDQGVLKVIPKTLASLKSPQTLTNTGTKESLDVVLACPKNGRKDLT